MRNTFCQQLVRKDSKLVERSDESKAIKASKDADKSSDKAHTFGGEANHLRAASKHLQAAKLHQLAGNGGDADKHTQVAMGHAQMASTNEKHDEPVGGDDDGDSEVDEDCMP